MMWAVEEAVDMLVGHDEEDAILEDIAAVEDIAVVASGSRQYRTS